jgi:hypothetical protein
MSSGFSKCADAKTGTRVVRTKDLIKTREPKNRPRQYKTGEEEKHEGPTCSEELEEYEA